MEITDKRFVQVSAEVHISWFGPIYPVYRLFVNDELFAEREWRYPGHYLDELIQIEAVPGKYNIRYEILNERHVHLEIKSMRVIEGPGKIKGNSLLKII